MWKDMTEVRDMNRIHEQAIYKGLHPQLARLHGNERYVHKADKEKLLKAAHKLIKRLATLADRVDSHKAKILKAPADQGDLLKRYYNKIILELSHYRDLTEDVIYAANKLHCIDDVLKRGASVRPKSRRISPRRALARASVAVSHRVTALRRNLVSRIN